MKKLLFILSLFLIITSCNKTPIITLSVDKTEISADGKDFATFKVVSLDRHNNEDDVTKDCRIFFADSKKELGATTFSTTEPNSYSFYAAYEDVVSNEISITAIEVEDDDEDENEGEDENEDEEQTEAPIVLSASTDTITADGKDIITFTVMQDTVDVTGSVKIFVNEKLINSNKYKTYFSGSYTVYAKKNDTIVSNEITFFAKEVGDDNNDEDEETTIELAASKTTIVADGNDKVTFTVTENGKDITSEATIFVGETELSLNVFTSTTAGTYTAYAIKDEVKSNEITITVEKVNEPEPEKPITLTASTTNITANGSDAVTFTVMQDNNDVTSQSSIFVNGSKLNGNKFTTYTSGSYTAYAQKNEVKSNEITITVTDAPDMGRTVVFAEGVTLTSGWYDVNKLSKNGGDINMCWAASASNIIEWWQDRYVAAGNTLPAGAVTGPSTKSYDGIGAYNLALMELYRDLWKDNDKKGAYTDQAVIWYFEGSNVQKYASEGSCAQPNAAGGYYSSVWNEILPKVYHEYKNDIFPNEFYDLISKEYNSYSSWGNGSGVSGTDQLKKFSDLVVEFIDRGVVSLAITLNKSGGLLHATTLWGYEIDNATGMLTKIWITDSDDMHQSGNGDPTVQMLREYSVSHDSSSLGKIKFTGAPYGNCWALSLYPVSGYNSAK
jgi:hypothetical protein